ncbi:MAG: hypothetical protein H0V44_06430 [Planctomycetes bacterium]|nr:hypothetical protein [Planctomycetota bacterium]
MRSHSRTHFISAAFSSAAKKRVSAAKKRVASILPASQRAAKTRSHPAKKSKVRSSQAKPAARAIRVRSEKPSGKVASSQRGKGRGAKRPVSAARVATARPIKRGGKSAKALSSRSTAAKSRTARSAKTPARTRVSAPAKRRSTMPRRMARPSVDLTTSAVLPAPADGRDPSRLIERQIPSSSGHTKPFPHRLGPNSAAQQSSSQQDKQRRANTVAPRVEPSTRGAQHWTGGRRGHQKGR